MVDRSRLVVGFEEDDRDDGARAIRLVHRKQSIVMGEMLRFSDAGVEKDVGSRMEPMGRMPGGGVWLDFRISNMVRAHIFPRLLLFSSRLSFVPPALREIPRPHKFNSIRFHSAFDLK